MTDASCSFRAGSLWCVNDPCPNPRHRVPVPTTEFEPGPLVMWPLPCIECGTVGRSGVTGLCPTCRRSGHRFVENPGTVPTAHRKDRP